MIQRTPVPVIGNFRLLYHSSLNLKNRYYSLFGNVGWFKHNCKFSKFFRNSYQKPFFLCIVV